ncbi:MAG: hypothetical protein FWG88_06355 [Oscillospiraceae bacterium]|nr:hypothetical protein [Oscillospiraceae bacterium]
MMKRKISIRLLSLIIALVVLGGAVGYAAMMGSPYDTVKKALLDALSYTNVTIVGEAKLSINGEVFQSEKMFNVIGESSSLTYYYTENGEVYNFYYNSDTMSMYGFASEDSAGVNWYSASVYGPSYSTRNRSYSMMSIEELNSAEMRFIELLIDVLVGDLKNNITMSSRDGVRIIQGTLTDSQIPELVKAGIDVAIEQQGRWFYDWQEVSFDGVDYITEEIRIESGEKTVTTYRQTVRAMTDEEQEAWDDGSYSFYRHNSSEAYWGETYYDGVFYINEGSREQIAQYKGPAERSDFNNYTPYNMPLSSLVIDYVHGEATIDSKGNLLSLGGNATITIVNIFDDSYTMEIDVSVAFTDIGTSNPEFPIPGAQTVLTYEYLKSLFGDEQYNYYVYFNLNDDGSINLDSLTTTYPISYDQPVGRSSYGNPFPVTEYVIVDDFDLELMEASKEKQIDNDASVEESEDDNFDEAVSPDDMQDYNEADDELEAGIDNENSYDAMDNISDDDAADDIANENDDSIVEG